LLGKGSSYAPRGEEGRRSQETTGKLVIKEDADQPQRIAGEDRLDRHCRKPVKKGLITIRGRPEKRGRKKKRRERSQSCRGLM